MRSNSALERKAVEARDDQNVADAQLPQQLFQGGPLAGGLGNLLLEQPAAAGLVQPPLMVAVGIVGA